MSDVLLFAAVIVVVIAARICWYWFRRWQARDWIEAPGRVERGEVHCKSGVSTIGAPHVASDCTAEISYSYEAGTDAYGGYVRRHFSDEQLARDIVKANEGNMI